MLPSFSNPCSRNRFLGAFLTFFGQHNRFVFFILLVIFRGQRRDELVDGNIQLGRKLGWARNNQRRPRFVDQDRVDFVDDREIERSSAPSA
jgi:hypothetical protein